MNVVTRQWYFSPLTDIQWCFEDSRKLCFRIPSISKLDDLNFFGLQIYLILKQFLLRMLIAQTLTNAGCAVLLDYSLLHLLKSGKGKIKAEDVSTPLELYCKCHCKCNFAGSHGTDGQLAQSLSPCSLLACMNPQCCGHSILHIKELATNFFVLYL